jgi:hypothetical protein
MALALHLDGRAVRELAYSTGARSGSPRAMQTRHLASDGLGGVPAARYAGMSGVGR